jgi:serine/threonine protein kinase/tetratricopeptide (TPR) repeat protein
MPLEFQRDYLLRLPLPLAQLYSRSHNAKDARGRHDNTFYLFEALVKLTAAPAVAAYLQDIAADGPRSPAVDRLLVHLALPSLGQWLAMTRELARYFGQRPDAAAHPLGHLWEQLNRPRPELTALVALYRRIKNGPDGAPGGDAACSVLQVLEALVQYRNGVFGHGAGRFDTFYEREMGPLLFPAANEVLAEGVLDGLGPSGSRLVYLTEVRTVAEGRAEVSLRELVGLQGERQAPLALTAAQAATVAPNRVAVLWPGRPEPLRLDPLLLYRESELAEEVLFLNRDRNGKQAEYLSYTTGRTERDQAAAPALAELLRRLTGRSVDAAEVLTLAEQSGDETPTPEGPPGPTPAGWRLGEYEVLREIGRGGMGVVYLARQLSLGRLVALKMLPAELAGDEVALARFRREIRSLGRCEHPNIIKVLSSGALPDGRLYYAMEYVPGCDLEQVWRELTGSARHSAASRLGGSTWANAVLSASRKQREQTEARQPAPPGAFFVQKDPENRPAAGPALPLPPLPQVPALPEDPGGYARRVALLVRDAALALQAVHDQQMVHRDVKPANLMLTPDGSRVVLMDFGLAKGQSLSLAASRQGGLLGTLRYAAPEQLAAASLKVGPAADVRGLGVTLWELLTRRRLFEETADEKQLAEMVHERDVPLLRSVDPSLDRDLEAVVARATERGIADRIPTARELAGHLQLYLDGKPLPLRPPGTAELLWRWVRRNPAVVGLLAALALLVVGGAAVVTGLWLRAEGNRAEAEANARAARQTVNDFFTRVSEEVLLEEAGLQPLRKQLLERALAYYQDFLDRRGDSPELEGDLGGVYARVGFINLTLGSNADALAAFRRGRDILERIVRDNPGDGTARKDLARCYHGIGVVQFKGGQTDEAAVSLDRACALLEQLVREDPDAAELRIDLAETYLSSGALQGKTVKRAEAMRRLRQGCDNLEGFNRDHPSHRVRDLLARLYLHLGQLQSESGRLKEALRSVERAGRYQDQLLRDNPNALRFREGQVQAYFTLAQLQRTLGRTDQELEALEKAAAAMRQLVEANPRVPSFRVHLADIYNNAGLALERLNRLDESLRRLEQARDLQLQMLADNPDDLDFRSQLAGTYHNLGNVLLRLGRREEARLIYRQAIEQQVPAFLQAPDRFQHQEFLLKHHGNLIHLLEDLGRPDEAVRTGRRYQDLWEEAIRRHPSQSRSLRQHFAKVLNDLASFQGAGGHPEEAQKILTRSRELLEQLLREAPQDASLHSDLGATLHNLGRLLQERGRLRDALGVFQQAVDHQRRAFASDPREIQHRIFLSNHYHSLALVQDGLWKTKEALGSVQQSCDLMEGVLRDNPGVPGVRRDLATRYGFLSLLQRRTAQLSEAVRTQEKARELFVQLVREDPNDVQSRCLLAEICARGAVDLIRQKKRAEAAALFRQAADYQLEAAFKEPRQPLHRKVLDRYFADLGRLQRELGRPADAARTALERQQHGRDNPDLLCESAVELSLCAALVGRGKSELTAAERSERQQYADQAMEALRLAVRKGFHNVNRLRYDPGLIPLRSRRDFKEVLAEAEKMTR